MKDELWENIDFHDEFRQWYIEIIKDFNFDQQKDREARDMLSHILNLKEKNWNANKILHLFYHSLEKGKIIFIFGCGPSLETTIGALLKRGGRAILNHTINLAADGATVFLTENEIPITATFTDLDGIRKEDFGIAQYMIVHAHGDNIDKLEEFKPEIINFEKVIGTTQVQPLENIVNPGGFTDGDRILFFLRSLLSSEQVIYLIGMDFNEIVGRYSKPTLKSNQIATPIKKKKLDYAFKLITWLAPRITNKLYFVNSSMKGEDFKPVTIDQFLNQINGRS